VPVNRIAVPGPPVVEDIVTDPGAVNDAETVIDGPVAVPPGVITVTAPVAAAPVLKKRVVGEITVNFVLAVVDVPTLTAVAAHKLVPVIVTATPLVVLTVLTEEITGSALSETVATPAVKPVLDVAICSVAVPAFTPLTIMGRFAPAAIPVVAVPAPAIKDGVKV
jgi:hypothetical protein